jgi:hypothetical protein
MGDYRMVEKKVTTAVAKKTTKKQVTSGRPSPIMDEDTESKLIEYIKFGTPVNRAVAAVGISERTFYTWMNRGINERERLATVPNAKPNPTEGVYLQFLQSVERARGEAITKKVAVIAKAGNEGDWRAAAWYLERQAPEEFGKIDKVEHTGSNGDAIKIQIEMGDLEDKIAKVLAARKR